MCCGMIVTPVPNSTSSAVYQQTQDELNRIAKQNEIARQQAIAAQNQVPVNNNPAIQRAITMLPPH
jgi:hypothetical protein